MSGASGAGLRVWAIRALTLVLIAFVLTEVNLHWMPPQTHLAAFALLGLSLTFLISARGDDPWWRKGLDVAGVAATVLGVGFVLAQNAFSASALADRAGAETGLDIALGAAGLVGVLLASWRVIGPALPLITAAFIVYAFVGPWLPEFLFPHRGYSLARITSQGFLQSQGVFGIAMHVMFAYVFLFVVFGVVLQQTGAIRFITASSRRLFLGTVGGAAKVSVIANAMMGSLSGSAVADAATTGTVTIPLMRSTGFTARAAAGITAAASSGAALVPPVMGAGAYMMLELVSPPVSYLEIIRAAILPAVLYYTALLMMVHLHVRATTGGGSLTPPEDPGSERVPGPAGLVFGISLVVLVVALLFGRTVFRAVSLALLVVVAVSWMHPSTRIRLSACWKALGQVARGAAPLVAAAGAVGIILGIVTLTGVGTRFPTAVLSVAGDSFGLALVLLMVGSVVLGMGLPSAVCYLLMAILVGPVIGQLGSPPLAVHFFIFYFGMMSMVTPPVALAAYTTAGIARTPIFPAALTAFRFALAGFALPYFFVFRPELLLIPDGNGLLAGAVVAFGLGILVVVALSAGLMGWLRGRLGPVRRSAALAAALLMAWPPGAALVSIPNLVGVGLLSGVLWRRGRGAPQPPMQ